MGLGVKMSVRFVWKLSLGTTLTLIGPVLFLLSYLCRTSPRSSKALKK